MRYSYRTNRLAICPGPCVREEKAETRQRLLFVRVVGEEVSSHANNTRHQDHVNQHQTMPNYYYYYSLQRPENSLDYSLIEELAYANADLPARRQMVRSDDGGFLIELHSVKNSVAKRSIQLRSF